MTKSEFAAALGVSRPYISKLIRQGKLHTEVDGSIDLENALAELGKTLDPGQRKKEFKVQQVNVNLAPGHAPKKAENKGQEPEDDPSSMSFYEAKTENEILKAKTAKIEYDKLVGSILDREETEKAVFNLIQDVRDSLLNLPDRIAPNVSSDHAIQHSVRQNLLTEITHILEEMSCDFNKKADI